MLAVVPAHREFCSCVFPCSLGVCTHYIATYLHIVRLLAVSLHVHTKKCSWHDTACMHWHTSICVYKLCCYHLYLCKSLQFRPEILSWITCEKLFLVTSHYSLSWDKHGLLPGEVDSSWQQTRIRSITQDTDRLDWAKRILIYLN